MAGHHGRLLADALQTVSLLGTPTVGLRILAADVLDASCRRHFVHTAALFGPPARPRPRHAPRVFAVVESIFQATDDR